MFLLVFPIAVSHIFPPRSRLDDHSGGSKLISVRIRDLKESMDSEFEMWVDRIENGEGLERGQFEIDITSRRYGSYQDFTS